MTVESSDPQTSSLESKYKLLQQKYDELKKLQKWGLVWEETEEDDIPSQRFETTGKDIVVDDTRPTHWLIKGDNLPALKTLQEDYTDKVDVIYIDPPYNTGNKDFVYEDNYVNKEDQYRHSKWLSFIQSRLRASYPLLKETGVIFVSIDDTEQARLKLLLDEIFGEKNFIANLIWHNSFKSQSGHVNTNHEYILVYAKNLNQLNKWHVQREPHIIEELYKIVKKAKTVEIAQERLRKKIKSIIRRDHKQSWLRNYGNILVQEDGTRKIYYPRDLSVPGNPCERTLSNGKTLKPLGNRAWQSAKKINRLIEENRVSWKGTRPYEIKYLEESTVRLTSLIPQGIYTRNGKEDLKRLFSQEACPFSFPKPVSLITYLLRMVDKTDLTVLDFFAGSGTTGQAVIEMNENDNGKRTSILVTDSGASKVDIAEDICYERLRRALLGTTQNLRFSQLQDTK